MFLNLRECEREFFEKRGRGFKILHLVVAWGVYAEDYQIHDTVVYSTQVVRSFLHPSSPSTYQSQTKEKRKRDRQCLVLLFLLHYD
jgi:hypothetical protein